MDEHIKIVVRLMKAMSVVVLAFAGAAYVYAYSLSVNPGAFRSFSVSADGKAVAIPDIAEFTLSVITEGGQNVSTLQAQNSKKINNIDTFLREQNITDKDIKTSNYNVSPQYQYYNCVDKGPCPPPQIAGYSINQSVDVKIRDFSKIGDILAGVVQNGANSVSQLTFTIDDPTIVQNQARAQAIVKAQAKAIGIAQAAGFRVGHLLSIQESVPSNPYPYPMAMDSTRAVGGVVAPIIEPGSQETSVSVTLTYEMK